MTDDDNDGVMVMVDDDGCGGDGDRYDDDDDRIEPALSRLVQANRRRKTKEKKVSGEAKTKAAAKAKALFGKAKTEAAAKAKAGATEKLTRAKKPAGAGDGSVSQERTGTGAKPETIRKRSHKEKTKKKGTPEQHHEHEDEEDPPGIRERLKPRPKDDRLTRICKIVLAKLSTKMLNRLVANMVLLGTLFFSTMCSGSEIPVIAMTVLYNVLFGKSPQDQVKLKVLYSCESDRTKIPWGNFVFEKCDQVDPKCARQDRQCCFKDICTLKDGNVSCWTHEVKKKTTAAKSKAKVKAAPCVPASDGGEELPPCTVPSGTHGPVVSTVGISCKNLSKLFTGKGEQRGKTDWLETGEGSSGETYKGLFAHLRVNRPPIVHVENVEELLNEVNLAILKEDAAEINYYWTGKNLDSIKFGIPQGRKRAHGLLIDELAVSLDRDGLDAWSLELWQTVESLHLDPLPLAGFLLDNDDPYVAKCLEESTERMKGDAESIEDPVWRKGMDGWLKGRQLDWSICKPTPDLISSPWFKILPSRERLTLAALMHEYPAKAGHNVSQQVFRTDGQGDDKDVCLGTATPKERVYLPEQRRCMLGAESLHMQGVPMAWIKEAVSRKVATDTLLKNLAGNAYTAAVFLCLMIALLIHWPGPSMEYYQVPGIKAVDRFCGVAVPFKNSSSESESPTAKKRRLGESP